MYKKNMKETNETKQLLLDISKDLFEHNNFDKVSIDEICNRAGVTKGSFYHHFDSKYDIIHLGDYYNKITRDLSDAMISVFPVLMKLNIISDNTKTVVYDYQNSSERDYYETETIVEFAIRDALKYKR